jgi:hypothetical protein
LFSQEIKLHLKIKKREAGYCDTLGYTLSLVNLNIIESFFGMTFFVENYRENEIAGQAKRSHTIIVV